MCSQCRFDPLTISLTSLACVRNRTGSGVAEEGPVGLMTSGLEATHLNNLQQQTMDTKTESPRSQCVVVVMLHYKIHLPLLTAGVTFHSTTSCPTLSHGMKRAWTPFLVGPKEIRLITYDSCESFSM